MSKPDINLVSAAIDSFVRAYQADDVTPKEVQVRPSGDDVDVIKVWVDLGGAKVDHEAWRSELEAAINKNVPGASDYRVVVRAESV